MAKTLIQKIKRCCLESIIGGSLILSSGCAVGPLISGLGAMQPDPRIGAGMYAFGQGYTQIEAANAGKSENVVHVHVPQQNNNVGSSLPQNYVFAFNKWEDLNGDDICSLDEFFGRGKTVFTPDETVRFCLYRGHKSGNLRYVLKDGNGRILMDEVEPIKRNYAHIRCPPKPYKLPVGIYIAKFYIDDELVGSVGIEVVDKK